MDHKERKEKKMQYPKLTWEMIRHGITIEDISKALGLHRNTISRKLSDGSFSIEEAIRLQEELFSDKEIKELFGRGN